jgi:uncharacterized protein (TIGR03086 family)
VSDELDNFSLLIDELTRLVDGVRDDQLGQRTPCLEWGVRDLVNHLATGALLFGRCAEPGGLSLDDAALLEGDNLGDDFRASWREHGRRALAAFSRPGVLDESTVVPLPFGDLAAPAALHLAVFDLTAHAVDLARATGQRPPCDDVLRTALDIGPEVIPPAFRSPGFFHPEQPVGPDAPLADRLAAFAGREPWEDG